MTGEQLAALAGVLLSLGVGYIPGLSSWYDAREPVTKRLVMGALVVVVGIGALALSCANLIADVACTQAGLFEIVNAVIAALIANQAMFLISSRSKS